MKITNFINNSIILELFSLGFIEILFKFFENFHNINKEIQKEILWCLCNITSSDDKEISLYFLNNFSIITNIIDIIDDSNEEFFDLVKFFFFL